MNKENNTTLSVHDLTVRLRLRNKEYTVVEGLTFDLQRGKTTALVGESGCGKSMTALALMRILPSPPALPPTGNIYYDGNDILTLSEKKMRRLRGNKIAMIFQDPMSSLNPVFTVEDQLLEVTSLHLHLYGEEAKKRCLKMLRDVGIASPQRVIKEYPHQLSGGMKQRIMIAMALMCEPDILIADEPTTALDVTIQKQVLDLIRELQRSHGTALLLITHDMGVVAEMADEVIVMYASQAVEQGTAHDIFYAMSHPYTQGLFLSRPHSGVHQKKLHSIAGMVPDLDSRPQGCFFHPRCEYAKSCCTMQQPPTHTLKANHTTRCWLYDKTIQEKIVWEKKPWEMTTK
jgi:oligopeptide/dipeptide ABC transporter ATP-binding protein